MNAQAQVSYIKSTGNSSARYGSCEICRKWTSDTFIGFYEKTTSKRFKGFRPERKYPMVYAHKECLAKLRSSDVIVEIDCDEVSA